jgi:hypothetical protein
MSLDDRPPSVGPDGDEAGRPLHIDERERHDTFTRDELEAAEPVEPRSPRLRWLIGFGMGVFAAVYLSFPVGIVALPVAFTAAGAGMLFGTGIVFAAQLAFDVMVWLNGDAAATDRWSFVAWALGGFVALVAGIVGTLVVARRARQRRA